MNAFRHLVSYVSFGDVNNLYSSNNDVLAQQRKGEALSHKQFM